MPKSPADGGPLDSRESLLHVRNLTKRYRHLSALSGVTFSVREGEVLGLIGPNGSGKTTLFECLGGVLPYDAGSIERHGRVLTPAARAALMFYLPDSITPWPSQPVRWLFRYITGLFGGNPARQDGIVHDLGLGSLLDAPLGTLSKGQRKRTLLGLGLMTSQPLLLADEPFDGLDLRQSREVAATLRRHAAGGRTLFLSIHQIADAARICDRFVLLSDGRLCGEGTLDELSALARARGAAAGAGDLEEVFLALT